VYWADIGNFSCGDVRKGNSESGQVGRERLRYCVLVSHRDAGRSYIAPPYSLFSPKRLFVTDYFSPRYCPPNWVSMRKGDFAWRLTVECRSTMAQGRENDGLAPASVISQG
jgi:hypothetical protein